MWRDQSGSLKATENGDIEKDGCIGLGSYNTKCDRQTGRQTYKPPQHMLYIYTALCRANRPAV